jgi:GT2 family glycosyltransferase
LKKFAVLITVHNRIEKTLECLERLYQQHGMDVLFSLDVYLVDDGSTDGTWEIISMKYPKVKLIKGDGKLYWNRGMCLAWDTASKDGIFDGFLWLNNDTFLFADAVQKIFEAAVATYWRSIICGSTGDPLEPQSLTYGGCRIDRSGNFYMNYPDGSIQECDVINGNFVLVPNEVYKKVGTLDKRFSHAIGDNDYSLRAKKINIKSFSIDFVGTCSKNTKIPVWKSANHSISKRWKSLYHPLSGTPPLESFTFRYRHYGILQAFRSYLGLHIKVLFPALFN